MGGQRRRSPTPNPFGVPMSARPTSVRPTAVRPTGVRPTGVRIVLCDPHEVFRRGLRGIIELDHRLRVVGEGSLPQDAIRLVLERKPDVVMIDVSSPQLRGVIRDVATSPSRPRVIALSLFADARLVAHVLAAGAGELVLKDCDPNALRERLHAY